MTADRSQRNLAEDDEEEEEILQIDELMLPSSPPYGNKELKELFRNRMGTCDASRNSLTETAPQMKFCCPGRNTLVVV
jgi:hypothetical protein